jgi:tRNA(Ile)-lysidine synthase
MIAPGERVLVGLSGGADSVCLLIVLRELGYDVAAAHLNHGLRGDESDQDERFVQKLCEQLQIQLHATNVRVGDQPGNIEAEGRRARRRLFAELVNRHHYGRVALAHNRDDRIETFFLNLLRGSGSEGLTSMEPVTGNLIRPLIELPRANIETYLREKSQPWCTDSTNADRRFARNRLRLDVIPGLAARYNTGLSDALGRTVDILHEENLWMRELASSWLDRHGTKTGDSYVVNAEALSGEPPALQRRVIRLALKRIAVNLEDVTFDHVEAARELLGPHRSGRLVEFPGDLTIARSFGQLIVQNRTDAAEEFEYELQIPGEIHIPELNRSFRARIAAENDAKSSEDRVFVDGGNIGPYVRIRNWKPGDYYRPVGLPAGKLKKLFQRARIPRNQRHRWPVFVADSKIVWVASFPVAREFAPCGSSQKIVAFEATSF